MLGAVGIQTHISGQVTPQRPRFTQQISSMDDTKYRKGTDTRLSAHTHRNITESSRPSRSKVTTIPATEKSLLRRAQQITHPQRGRQISLPIVSRIPVLSSRLHPTRHSLFNCPTRTCDNHTHNATPLPRQTCAQMPTKHAQSRPNIPSSTEPHVYHHVQ